MGEARLRPASTVGVYPSTSATTYTVNTRKVLIGSAGLGERPTPSIARYSIRHSNAKPTNMNTPRLCSSSGPNRLNLDKACSVRPRICWSIMTLSVMSSVIRKRAGAAFRTTATWNALFLAIASTACLRLFACFVDDAAIWILIAAAAWTVAFVLFLVDFRLSLFRWRRT